MFIRQLVLILFLTDSIYAQTPPCINSETKAFDWQIGTWQSEDAKQIHEIKKMNSGCGIQETWKTDGKETAVGLKTFDDGRHNKTAEKKWFYSWTAQGFHQLWEGRKENGEWRFYRNWFLDGKPILSRTYWTKVSADKLERMVERSTDEGRTWQPWVKDVFNRVVSTSANVDCLWRRRVG